MGWGGEAALHIPLSLCGENYPTAHGFYWQEPSHCLSLSYSQSGLQWLNSNTCFSVSGSWTRRLLTSLIKWAKLHLSTFLENNGGGSLWGCRTHTSKLKLSSNRFLCLQFQLISSLVVLNSSGRRRGGGVIGTGATFQIKYF